MQIAKVVPKVRTTGEGIFDYSIPPQILPMIKIGLLVVVPFHGRKIEGIVIDIARSSKISVLSSILSVIDAIPVVDTIHIELARWMADYYLTDFSKALFEMIVPPAKRILKKQSSTILDIKKKSPNQSAKKYLVVADFPTRLKFYLQAIKKTLARHQQVIILVPDLSLIPYFTKYIKNKVAILHAGLNLTQRWQIWDEVRRGEVDIVIGSNSALFSPVKNLGLIIIDQEENETYKSGQAPRFHAVKVAEKLSQLTAARLVLCSLTPRLETYFDGLEHKYLFKKTSKEKPDISIVDMNFERQVLSLPLQTAVEEAVAQAEKILLVLNRKENRKFLRCTDCGQVHQKPDKQDLVQCPQCFGYNLKPVGLNTAKLEKFVRDFWPKKKTIRIEKDGAISHDDFDIAIVTNFALKMNLPKIGLVGVIDADQGLNFPDFRSAEKTFQNLYKFLRLGNRGLIQTHLPENQVLKNLAGLNYEGFFLDEIANRQKSDFPPFTSLTRLLYRNSDEKIASEEAKNISQKLSTNYSPLFTLLGPSSPFTSQQRGYFYQQILIKSKKTLPTDIKNILKNLPKGWIVDRDPYDLI